MKLQDDVRLVICPLKDIEEPIVYNGMQIYTLWYMIPLVDPLAPFHK